MTPQEQIKATGAQLYAKQKMLNIHLQKNETQTFRTQAENLYQEATKLVEAYPDWIHSYVVYCNIVFSIAEKYSGLDTKQDEAHAIAILAQSMTRLIEFVYPNALKHERASNLCIANSLRIISELTTLIQNYQGDRQLVAIAVDITTSLYNKSLEFHPYTDMMNETRALLTKVGVDLSQSFVLSKEDMLNGCRRILTDAEEMSKEDENYTFDIDENSLVASIINDFLATDPKILIEQAAAKISTEDKTTHTTESKPKSSPKLPKTKELVKDFVKLFLGSIITTGLLYVLFCSPISIIAKWPALTVNQAAYYVIGCIVGIFIAWFVGKSLSTLLYNNWAIAEELCAISPLGMWAAYGMIRLYPALEGVWSWIFFVLFAIIFILSIYFISNTIWDISYESKCDYYTRKKLCKKPTFVSICIYLAFTSFIFLPLVMAFDYAHKTLEYHHGEYHELIEKSVAAYNEDDYPQAKEYLDEALKRKTNDKRQGIVLNYIEIVSNKQAQRIPEIKSEIKEMLNKFKASSFKNGKPESELQLTQEKIDILKKNCPDDPIVNEYQKRLDYHKNRTK